LKVLNPMKLLVVILNYRVTDLTIGCLRSLADQVDRVPGTKVVVCENGSEGDAAERIREAIDAEGWGSWAHLMAVHPNRGFTGGNNLVIRAAQVWDDPPEYYLLLNADTLVQDGALDALVDFMDSHPKAGIAGSLLLSADGKPQGSPYRFLGIANQFDIAFRLGLVSWLLKRWSIAPEKTPGPSRCDWVSGASMILRARMLSQIGLLDEGLFTYFDDVDLCVRARRSGWETWFVPQSRITHFEGSSTGIRSGMVTRRPLYWYEARRRYFLKNYGSSYAALVDGAHIVGFGLWRLRRRIQRKPETDPPYAAVDFIRNSVFMKGFAVPEVGNPALRGSQARTSLQFMSTGPRPAGGRPARGGRTL